MYHVVVSSLPLPSSAAPTTTTSSSSITSPSLPPLALEGELSVCRVEWGRIHLFRRFFDEPTTASSTVSSSSSSGSGVVVLLLALPSSLTVARLLSVLCSADVPLSALRSCLRVCDWHSGQHSVLLEWADGTVASLFCQSVDGRPLPAAVSASSLSAFSAQPSSAAEAERAERCLAFALSDRPAASTDASTVVGRSGFAELPRCPRCLLRLDTSASGLVAPFSIGQPDGRRDRERRDNHFEAASQTETQQQQQQQQQQSSQGSLILPSAGHSTKPASQDSSIAACCCWSDVHCGVCDKLEQAVFSSSSIECEQCSVVGVEREAIWLCLVCGHVGCGRNLSGHAAVHFELTGHRYCIELLQHYVWDYHADGFVHRVHGRELAAATAAASQRLQSDDSSSRFARGEYDSDAELDEADETDDWLHTDEQREGQSHSPPPTDDSDEDDGLLHGKLASITSHYSNLLSSELSKQADFFEQLMSDKRSMLDSSHSQLSSQMTAVQLSLASLQCDVDSSQQAVRQCSAQLAERRRRNGAQHDENSFIRQINASLINDQQQQHIKQQQQQHVSSPRTLSSLAAKQRRIGGLQADIARIMQQLDTAGSGSKHSSSNTARR